MKVKDISNVHKKVGGDHAYIPKLTLLGIRTNGHTYTIYDNITTVNSIGTVPKSEKWQQISW